MGAGLGGSPCQMSGGAEHGGGSCSLRSYAPWVMITWGPSTFYPEHTDTTENTNLPNTSSASVKNGERLTN